MPNNRKQAMQRLIYLDPAFFEDYKQFMSFLLVKGHVRWMEILQLERCGTSHNMMCTTQVNIEKSV